MTTLPSDITRDRAGFLTAADLAAGIGATSLVFDPVSTLVSRRAVLGTDNRLYPGVLIECDADSEIVIGAGNLLRPGTQMIALGGARIEVGDHNQFGPGCTLIATARHADIRVGSGGRYWGGVWIEGGTELGDGSQVLGAVAVRGSRLEGGGTYLAPDPDARGAVLKGAGRAHFLVLPTGTVIDGAGRFDAADITRQSFVHAKG